MITLDHPLVAAYLAAPPGRLGPADHAMLVDQLQDAGCDLAGMLPLYAGTKEGRYTDGLPREVLVAFVRAVGGDVQAGEVLAVPRPAPVLPQEVSQAMLRGLPDGLVAMALERLSECLFVGYRCVVVYCPCLDGPPSVATFRPDRGPLFRKRQATRVELRTFRGYEFGTVASVYRAGACPVCGRVYWSKDDHGPEVRDQKRRVLALFGGVQVTLWVNVAPREQGRFSGQDATEMLRAACVRGSPWRPGPLETGSLAHSLGLTPCESCLLGGEQAPDGWRLGQTLPARDLVPPEHLIHGGLPE